MIEHTCSSNQPRPVVSRDQSHALTSLPLTGLTLQARNQRVESAAARNDLPAVQRSQNRNDRLLSGHNAARPAHACS
jgi:hypothetical protein